MNFYQYFSKNKTTQILPNPWDIIALLIGFGIIAFFTWGTRQITAPYHLGQAIPISLNPTHLPEYALLTVMRMLIALVCSLLFTFIFATWAAKSPRAGKLIIPCIDILQSVPNLGYLSITIAGFIALFPNSQLGPECAAIFTIFTAQAWNMALSFYQSLQTVPDELTEAANMFHLSAWQRFWRVEVPFAMPGLLWNMMLSMSGSWIFLVASEAISVANQNITLPGIGSYLGLAITQADMKAVGYTIITMLIVIFLYDQILFRPLLSWAEKFKAEQTGQEQYSRPWVVIIFQRTRLLRYLKDFFGIISDKFINTEWLRRTKQYVHSEKTPSRFKIFLLNTVWYITVTAIVVLSLYLIGQYIFSAMHRSEISHVFLLGCFTALRVFAVIIISTFIWVPIGVWIGLRPRIAEYAQPLAQFLAAFPMNVLFPVVVIGIMKYQLNVQIWITPLMLLGSQWYILFNVIAGTAAIPKELQQVAENFGIRGWQWWRRLILPAIFPYYITGTLTATGNAWNTSVIAEVVTWGSTTLTASGLGAYITQYANAGNFPAVALGMAVMSLFVLTLNRILWRPLYNLAQTRYRLD